MDNLNHLLPGTEVVARGLRWVVTLTESLGSQTLYRLRGVEGAVLGHEIDVLHPFEVVEPRQHDLQPQKAAPLANWLVYHQSFLLEQTLGSGALMVVQPGRLRLEPYQLVPVLRAIRMSRVRIMLADGVGLGKTVQAGLVITELFARRLAHRLLVVSPAGPLLHQWHDEMRERFGLRLEVIDRASLEEIRRKTELGANPFDHVPLGLVSVDFLKQERILELLERASYDVVVIDEAHHCMDLGATADREDSLRRRLSELLAKRCDSLLLLTATPHDGNDRSFASLCELLDPSLVDGRGALRGERYRTHVVRRLKKHILETDPSDPTRKIPKFPERIVTPIAVTPDTKANQAFGEMHHGLLALVGPELRRAFRARRYSDVLSWIALLKRSVSTVAACASTLSVVRNRYQGFQEETATTQDMKRQRIKTLRDYARKLSQFGTITAEEESDKADLEAEDIADQLAATQREIRRGAEAMTKVTNVVEHLTRLVDLANEAKATDPKLVKLLDVIRAIREAEPRANILVYTEYVDSLTAVVAALSQEYAGQVITMQGEDVDATRQATTEKFRTHDNLIMVCTDTAAEGLNLHHRCHNLIHLELPFNPNRLEQRNGRIDRYGQTFQPHVQYMYLTGTFEDRILLRLIAKYEKQRARLTFVPNTLGLNTASDAGQVQLLKGLLDEDTKLFQPSATLESLTEDDENHDADPAVLELLEEIDRSLNGFRKAAQSNLWLGEQGLNADESLATEAMQAQERGYKAESVDLAHFVCDAARLDAGRIEGTPRDPIFTIHLPSAWVYGLEQLQGYDPEKRVVRLTTDIDTNTDQHGNSVGFLGRAHPLVRLALDRVRSLSFGANAQIEDPRVSVLEADVTEPTLLCTYLGRVSSQAGRELERVLAIRITQSGGTEFYGSADQWVHMIDPKRGARTTDVWKDRFESWGATAQSSAEGLARTGFQPFVDDFLADRRRVLRQERADLEQWLRNRTDDITGPFDPSVGMQAQLFGEGNTPGVGVRWQTIEDPAKRLVAFQADSGQPNPKRSEADSAWRIYQQRTARLDSLSDLGQPEIVQLGMLMLVPEVNHGV